jgi:uncharacterized SAM-binding protein YcdF (DUF218 family)
VNPLRWPGRAVRLVVRGVLLLVVIGVGYLAVTFIQVWRASRLDQARPSQAIIVLGAAQYDGRPSPVLQARLDHVLILWQRRLAPVVVVTGGKEPGDRFTEATASATYLDDHGVPDSDILREVSGRDSWASLSASALFLRQRGISRVLLVSDPFHDERLEAMSSELGLTGHVSPTRTSPIKGVHVLPYMARETVAVAIGRIIGFRREVRLEQWIKQ